MNFDISSWKSTDFKNLKSLELRFSKIIGSIDESFCSISIMVNDNNLSGKIPSCFYCFKTINDVAFNSMFINNQFSNFPPIPFCTSILPNAWYNETNKYLYIYGQDIGKKSTDMVLSGQLSSIVMSPVIPLQKFESTYILKKDLPLMFDVTFNANASATIPTQTFTLSTFPTNPNVTNIIPNGITKQIVFKGLYFSYNITSIKVKLGSFDCQVVASTFYIITCSTPNGYDFTQTNVLTTISIDNNSPGNIYPPLLAQYMINMNYENKICAIKQCPNNCSNQGTCNQETGICDCIPTRDGEDCSNYICIPDCLNGGVCIGPNNKCKCPTKYSSSDCSVLSHYVTSVSPCSINGGNVTLYGLFPETTLEYIVKIGIYSCQVKQKSNSEIQCLLGPGTGTHNVIVTLSNHSDVYFTGVGIFNYFNTIKECPSNCTSSSNGQCNTNTGSCFCQKDYIGFDCSTKIELESTIPPVETKVDTNYGGAQIYSEQTAFNISVIELNEISIDGTVVANHTLQNNWIVTNKQNNIYTFEQNINNLSKIIYTIEEVTKEKEFQFGSTTYIVPKESLKISVNISNYQYQNSLNTLTLSFVSRVSDKDNGNNNNKCNEKETVIDSSNANNQRDVNYIKVFKNSHQLIGRFINKVISDGRETFLSSSINTITTNNNTLENGIILSLNLPHCEYSCFIDPDFSVLVTSDYKSDCIKDKNNWIIPVAVVVPCVFVVASSVAIAILYKKNRLKLKLLGIKLKKFT
ncbi:hypothetical protein DICPUDRAFT_43640 [Dictyostelium purpureum]|uniref:EGF-like domain-containing protein n=1 Tax=Dictyostelium purpureum TaxID=5786 RepID=F1A4I0_DICPU|nr:uncharacterized protein DICPUDRAFT_43640 [Dictyostelium purpureum]EGC28897.1 hypothetical protein DICPUDRAFT_43640 [Dictyostelium purpureum]|eukprot:XP_003294574.1 hypothetical protein DICPUDRAFT_43640 [Dictyostelium purpureum]